MMEMKAILLLSLLALCLCERVSYHGQKVINIKTKSQREVNILTNLLSQMGDEDVWTNEGILVNGVNHVRVKNTSLATIGTFFQHEVFIEDIGKLIEEAEKPSTLSSAGRAPGGFFDNYRRYAEIVAELKNLAAKYPSLTKLVPSIGKSVEGRDIPAIHVSALGFNNASVERIFYEGGQHAREWIGPATVLYQLTKLLENYGEDPLITQYLNTLEFVIIPLSNPDGYEYAWTNDRLWRKNRKKNTGTSFGVDLNRNWDSHWGGSGSSNIPTSETYRGIAAFSEPESRAISNYINSVNPDGNILAAIDFHSYSQLVLRPYGWTTAKCPDETALKLLGDGISYEISKNSGKAYTSQRSIQLYITTGTASDWYYQEGIWAAYTIELRDTGQFGFVLPPSQIIPTGEEIWASMRYFIQAVVDSYPRKK